MRLEIVSHRLHAARIIVISLFCILAGFGLTDHAVAQTDPEISWHEVYPGDTWSALAWQYGVAENQLWSLNQLLNSQRQPAIGSDVLVAGLEESSQFRGRLVQPTGRGLLEISSRHNEDPWQIALLNHLASPYSAPLGRTLFVPDGVSLPRELPVGFESLVFSNSLILPGQAIAFRASLSQPITVTANLGGSDFILPQTSDTAAGIIGTGAFFQPGVYDFEISIEGHPNWIQPTLFQPGEWSYEQITLTGSAAEIDQESIRQEWERLSSIWSQVTPEFMWKDSFRLPIDDFLEFSSPYGAHRSYNGGPYRSFHEGVDFSAYGGTPVLAPASGNVVLAEFLYVRGGAVLIDHGYGVYSGLYHLSEVLVQPGDMVEEGHLIGRVGTTGLSTGNHLHWDLLIGGTQVDGRTWLDNDLGCWLLESFGRVCGEI